MSDKALPMAITGAVAVIGVGMAAIIFLIHQVTNDVKDIRTEVDQLKATVASVQPLTQGAENMNARINELDSGLLAMATMLKLDGAELSSLMNQFAGNEVSAPAAAEQAPAIQLKARSTPVANVEAASDTPAWAMATPSENADAARLPELTIDDVDGLLVKRISDNWSMPPGDISDLRTELVLKLGRDGAMNTVSVTKSSGNRIFDDSAVGAIMRIKAIPEVAALTDELYQLGYASRNIVFTPELGGQ